MISRVAPFEAALLKGTLDLAPPGGYMSDRARFLSLVRLRTAPTLALQPRCQQNQAVAAKGRANRLSKEGAGHLRGLCLVGVCKSAEWSQP